MRGMLIFLLGLGIALYAPAAFSTPICPKLENPCAKMVCKEKINTGRVA